MIRLFKVSIPSSAVALILSESALIFACYLLAAHLALDVPLVTFLFDQSGYWQISFETAVIVLGLYFSDLYENFRVRSRIRLVQQFCLVLGIAFLLQSLLAVGRFGILLPKWVMVYGSGVVLVVVPLWRVLFTTLARKSSGGQKLLFLGSSAEVQEIVQTLNDIPELGMSPIGYLDTEPGSDPVPAAPRLGSLADLDAVLSENHPARLVVGLANPEDLPVERLLELRLGGLRIDEASSIYEAIFGRIPSCDLPPSRIVFARDVHPRTTNVALQSFYSFVTALIALLAALPVMAGVALIVILSSPGPVLVRERCAGLHGKEFFVFKFRSAQIGNWIRALRLNLLPQLFNVLRGEMSIVGPRPERTEFVSALEEKIPYYRQRLAVKPGITGWAQINEKDISTIEDSITKLEFDRYYIKNLSFWLDAYIVLHTLKRALLGR
ncbi:MAG TPA: sugar transferase [Bryobacteraceae bacterium]|nr:sugar transferase [Bryobacteraceae bacterium]